MIIVDAALRQRQIEGNPIRVGMVGAGAMGRMLALQITTVVPGMELVRHMSTVPTSDRHVLPAGANGAFTTSGMRVPSS